MLFAELQLLMCVLSSSVEYLESRLLKSQLNVLFKSYIALQILLSTLEYLEKVPRPLQHIMTQKYQLSFPYM